MPWWLLSVTLLGCGPKSHGVEKPFVFEARPTFGDVAVMPVLGLYSEPEVRMDGHVGAGVPWLRGDLRKQRTEELRDIPDAFAMSFPGAVNGALGEKWEGYFRVGRYPMGGRDRLSTGLKGKANIDECLTDVATNVEAEAVLFTWVTMLRGDPLSAEAFPGELIHTAVGPVLVDLAEEPYRVTAEVGMALVTSDGEVIVRYEDTFEAVLSGRHNSGRAGRDLANGLAGEVMRVWPYDARLKDGEPQIAFRDRR